LISCAFQFLKYGVNQMFSVTLCATQEREIEKTLNLFEEKLFSSS